MNTIKAESSFDKEQLKQELRNAREELLKKAKTSVEDRTAREIKQNLNLDFNTQCDSNKETEKLLEVSKDVKKSKKRVKEKKAKKSHKKEKKKKKKRRYSYNSSNSSETEEEIKKKKRKRNSSSSSNTSDNELEEAIWVEKPTTQNKTGGDLARDEWMTADQFLLPTYSKEIENNKEKKKINIDTYDPSTSSRELNPYWKDGGAGIPKFQRPKDYDDYDDADNNKFKNTYSYKKQNSDNWRKKRNDSKKSVSDNRNIKTNSHQENLSRYESNDDRTRRPRSTSPLSANFLTDQQMNELGAKLIKAEIMGDDDLAKKLKEKLENARKTRNDMKNAQSIESKKENMKEEHVLLTTTDAKGTTRPLSSKSITRDPYGSKKGKHTHKKAETHVDGERVRYFPDDDRYDIKQMFEKEKYVSSRDSDEQFVKIASKQRNRNDDLDDIFADKVRKEISEYEQDDKEKSRAIKEYEKFNKTLENCDKCFDSVKMDKDLIVSVGSTVYLSLPWHEGLQPGHCLIIPMQHISCSTQLDEDNWDEINKFRNALTRMFASRSQDVIFFEIARYLNRRPHMAIHCVPVKDIEMAPFYFKKAIQESEQMWSTNKQLITLKDRDLRRAIPKGLPYFWVHFGMDHGFAHVIEDQERFPANFAQEIIGGMLELNSTSWRKPRKEYHSSGKVKQLADWWKSFDCTV